MGIWRYKYRSADPATLTLDLSLVGVSFWAIRRVIPTRPLFPLKTSQSVRPAALAIIVTRRATCDSNSPNTLCLPSTPVTGATPSEALGYSSSNPGHTG